MSGNLSYFVNFGGDKFMFIPTIRKVVGKFFCSVFKCVVV